MRFGVLLVPRSIDLLSHGHHHNRNLLEALLRTNQIVSDMDPIGQNKNHSYRIPDHVWLCHTHPSIQSMAGTADSQEANASINKLQVIH